MILKKIKIENFHCYREQIINLADKTTVLIGRNGAGKSSALKAMVDCLSFIFSNSEASWGYRSLAAVVSDLSIAKISPREAWHDDSFRYASDICLTATAQYDGEMLPEWSVYKFAKEKANVQSSRYKDAYVRFMNKYQIGGRLPLLAYYSDRYPHITGNLGPVVKDMIAKDDHLDNCWGYYHWDVTTSCAEIWQLRFMRMCKLGDNLARSLEKGTILPAAEENVSQYLARVQSEIGFVKDRLIRFGSSNDVQLCDRSGVLSIADLYVDGLDDSFIVALFADGKRRKWDELPAGYERLYNIVFDIAYRSFILNGDTVEPQGVVFIDELDLHLHPSMEQDVLLRLRTAFPEVQFIVSTHSPMIISNFVQDNQNFIIQLERVGDQYSNHMIDSIYGMDYDLTLSSIMKTEPRHAYINMLCEKYVRLMRRKKIERATEVFDQIATLLPSERMEQLKIELARLVAEEDML